MDKMPAGILSIQNQIVNAKTAICADNTNFEEISINDLLENIRILLEYIIAEKRKKKIKKFKMKKKQNIKITEDDLKFIYGKDYEFFQEKVLSNCFCHNCIRGENGKYSVKIVNYEIFINDLNDVVLQGFCVECGGRVGRYSETGEVEETAKRVKKLKEKYKAKTKI